MQPRHMNSQIDKPIIGKVIIELTKHINYDIHQQTSHKPLVVASGGSLDIVFSQKTRKVNTLDGHRINLLSNKSD